MVKLEITEQQYNILIHSLLERPAKEVFELVQSLVNQTQALREPLPNRRDIK